MDLILKIIISVLIPLLLYSFALYLSEDILLKNISKYSKFYRLKMHVLLIYTIGFATALQAFLPSLSIAFDGNVKLAYYLNLYNVVMDLSIVFGIFILLFDFDSKFIDKRLIYILLATIIVHLYIVLFNYLNFLSGAILYLVFLLLSIYIYIKYKEPNKKRDFKINKNFIVRSGIIILQILIVMVLLIYSGKLLNNVAEILLSIGYKTFFVGYLISLLVFTIPNIIYGIVSWKVEKDINNIIASLIGEALAIFTIFSGVLAMISPVRFLEEDRIPIISSFFVLYISTLTFSILFYRNRIPKFMGIILIILGIILGFINNFYSLK